MKSKSVFSKVVALLIATLMVVAAIPCVFAGEDVTDDGFKYSVKDNKATITGYVGDAEVLSIPEKIDDADVVEISDSAFQDQDFVKEVVIPEGVQEIGYDAFRNCAALEKIELPSTLVAVGRDAFLGTAYERNSDNWDSGALYAGTVLLMTESDDLATEYTVKSGTTVLASQSFIFCHELTKVVIPEGVVTIGEDAFKECDALASVVISKSVTKIMSSAFEGCAALKDIHYAGAQNDWQNIEIGDYNDLLANVTMHYNSTGETPADTQATESAECCGDSNNAHNNSDWVKYCVIAVVLAAGYLGVLLVRSRLAKVSKEQSEENADDSSED